MRYSIALGAVLLTFLAACGTAHQLNSAPRGMDGGAGGILPSVQPDAAALAKMEPAYAEDEQARASWNELENDPGVPNVDYDPQSIFVVFNPQGQLPAGWLTASTGALAAAQTSCDASLTREDPRFVPLAAALAQRYGLTLATQIYTGSDRMAFFKAPAGMDVAAVLAQLRLEGQGLVARCAFEPLRHAAFTPNDPDYTTSSDSIFSAKQWGHKRVKCGAAWDYTLGDPNVWIAVCDTGVRITHQELAANVLNPNTDLSGYSLDVRNNDTTVDDDNGHGTFIAGMAAATGNNSRTILGVAPGCRVIPVKIANGGQTGLQYILGGCYLARNISNDKDKRVVVNLSWGSDQFVQQEKNMVDALTNNTDGGNPWPVLFVTAAGNDNLNTASYPSGYANSLSVGATGTVANSDGRADFGGGKGSNYGDYVDIAAPGINLKSCAPGNDAAYDSAGAGTSYAAPMVAAAAALLWSYDPTLTLAEVRAALEETGDPTTGFSAANPVLRMNLESAFASVSGVRCHAPKLDKLVYSGTVALTPTVTGGPTSVECRLNGELVDVLTTGPYAFQVDTSAISFGKASVEFKAINGADVATASIEFIVDNAVPTYPLAEYFNPADPRVFEGVDVKGYSQAFLTALKAEDVANWTPDTLASAGAGVWNYPVAGGFAGQGAYMGIAGQNKYANSEIDVLLSREVDLAGVTNPTLVFQHKYNVQDGGSKLDKLRVVVTPDDGLTWAPAKFAGTGNPAIWSGAISNFIQGEVDLADFSGQKVHVGLVLEADSSGVGEDAGSPSGWWVDSLVLSRNFSTAIPTIDSVVLTKTAVVDPLPAVSSASVVGNALSIGDFDVNITGPNKVTRVLYWLDLAPFGTLNLYDPTANVNGPNFLTNLNVPNRKNQMAILRVQYFDAQNNPGPEVDKTVYLFDLRGDTNADGTVNQADLDLYAGKIGLTAAAGGYSVFLDTDLDGTITEADAAGVGYFWGQSS